ncbi:hypothetical protein [Nocardia sp. NPDC049149]|uniref:hypothetical protein n=1 Tax=Nocardia sp. NPDC049149 TaxID=3364315 RepID=UPI00370F89FA
MVRVDFGTRVSLRQVTNTQHAVRSLLLDLVDFEVSTVPPRARFVQRPQLEVHEVIDTIEELTQADDAIGAFLRRGTGETRTHIVDVVSEVFYRLEDKRRPLTYVDVSSSLTVNPWEEVVSVAPTIAGNGALVWAVWQALSKANFILDFIVRASSFKVERGLRIVNLEHEAMSQQSETIRQLILLATESAEAAKLLRSIENVSPEVAGQVQFSTISEEEANERRRRLLRIVHSVDSEPD